MEFHLQTAWKNKCDFTRCGLRAAACGILCHRPHCYSCVRTLNRVHVHNSTQHASEIAGNSIAQLVEMYVVYVLRRPASKAVLTIREL